MGPKIKNPRSKNLIKRTEVKKKQKQQLQPSRRSARIAMDQAVPDNVFSFTPSVETNSDDDDESIDDTNIEEKKEDKNYNDSGDTYTLHVQILTNFSKGNPVLFTKDMLDVSEQDKKEGEKLNLETYPLFTYKVEYPLDKLRSIPNFQDRINVFFNKNRFNNMNLKNGANPTLNDENEKLLRMEKNMMAMLEILFPTSFPVIDNLHTSYNYLKSQISLNPIYADHMFSAGMSSHINIDGSSKTIKKVILYNDIVNHPKFRELIDGTINFMEYAKEENEDYLKFTKDQLEQKNRNKSLPIQYTNHEISFLNQYRSPIKVIADSDLQNIIDHNSKKEEGNKEVKEFYDLIQYLYSYYLKQDATTEENNEFEQLIRNGIYDLNLKDIRNPTKEVYVMLELHGGRIDDPDFDKCAYYDEELANQTQKLIQGSMNNSILIDEVIPKGKSFSSMGFTSNNSSNNQIPLTKNNENKKADLLTEAEIIEINRLLVDQVMKKYRDTRQGKNRGITLLQGVEKSLEELYDLKPKIPEYNQYLQGSTTETMVKDIIKDKFKPPESGKKISNTFAEIFKQWKSEWNKPAKIYNKDLYDKITDLETLIDAEKKKEANQQTVIERNPNISNKDEQIKVVKYHISVYEYYLFVIRYIIIPSLDKNYNRKNDNNNELVRKGQIKGGTKTRKKTEKKQSFIKTRKLRIKK